MQTLPRTQTTNKPDRIQRGLLIGSIPDAVIQTSPTTWTVQSESSERVSYRVTLDGCNCPDAGKGHLCKHLFAVHFIAAITIARLRTTTSVEAADAILEAFYRAAEAVPQPIKMTVKLEYERAQARLDNAHTQAAGPIYAKRECIHTGCTSYCQRATSYHGIAV